MAFLGLAYQNLPQPLPKGRGYTWRILRGLLPPSPLPHFVRHLPTPWGVALHPPKGCRLLNLLSTFYCRSNNSQVLCSQGLGGTLNPIAKQKTSPHCVTLNRTVAVLLMTAHSDKWTLSTVSYPPLFLLFGLRRGTFLLPP